MMKMKYGLAPICIAALLSGCTSTGHSVSENTQARSQSVPIVTHGAKLSTNSGSGVTNVATTNQAAAQRGAAFSGSNTNASIRNASYSSGNNNAALIRTSSTTGNDPYALSGASSSGSVYEAALQDPDISTQELERLRNLERENVRLRQQLQTSGGNSGLAADLPPNAKKGECYARVAIPAKYETTTERVLDREGADRIEVIPAEYANESQRVLTREASERIEVIPATYKQVTETVEVEPARTELKTIPARYENVTERILVREAYTTWKKGTGPITRVDEATGEILCLVEVPAEYNTVVRKELKTPARTEEVFIPAKTRTITRRVIDQPAATRVVPIPAQYDTISVRKLVRPAQERRVPIAATYKTVAKQRKVSDERLEWREILCETNTTPNVIRDVQRALIREGYKPGTPDGVLGGQTLTALRAFQVDNGLPRGQLTIATVRRLGINR